MYDKDILKVVLRGDSFAKIYRNIILEKLVDNLPLTLRNNILKKLLGKYGDVLVAPHVIFDPLYPELIEIHNNVIIGMRTMLVTHMVTLYNDNTFEKLKKNTNIIYLTKYHNLLIVVGKIVIADNVLIGGDVTIRPGTYIHNDVVIGSNSLVYGDITPGLWFGVPAKKIKDKI